MAEITNAANPHKYLCLAFTEAYGSRVTESDNSQPGATSGSVIEINFWM